MMRIPVLAAAAAVLLAGCNQKPAEPEAPKADTAPAAPAAPSLVKTETATAYSCEKEGRNLPITAAYGTNAEGKPDVVLVIKGESFSLVQDEGKAGRYSSATGLEAGKGLIWEPKGDEATLSEAPSDKIGDAAAATIVRTCKKK
jgi:hypothetical protein